MELRQYTLRDGQRDVLIDLFDSEPVQPQEANGMHVVGQFRDLDRPNMFVWLRGFTDMQARERALRGFYGGPVWAAHREAANATMVDSDNVLLLRPAWPGGGMAHQSDGEARAGAAPGGLVVTVYPLGAPVDADLARRAAQREESCTEVLAWYATEHSENTFPVLPVREGEEVLVSVSRGGAGSASVAASLPLVGEPQVLRLSPTLASELR